MIERKSAFRIMMRILGSLLGTVLFDLVANYLFFYTERLNQNMLWITAIRIAVFWVCYGILGYCVGRREVRQEYGEEEWDEEDDAEEFYDWEADEDDVEEEWEGYEDDGDDIEECEEIEDIEEEWEEDSEEYGEESEIEEEYETWEEDEEEIWEEEDIVEEEYEDDDIDEDWETDEDEYEDVNDEWEEDEDEDRDDEEQLEDDLEEYQEEIDNVTENVKQIFRQRNSTMLQAQKMMQSGNGSVSLEMAMHQNNEKCSRSSEEIKELMRRLQNPASGAEIERILYRMQKHLEVIRNENQKVLAELNRLLLKQQEKLRQERQERGDGDMEDLFRGCTDRESLVKRYRSLMKTFHPDNAGGDLEMTQRIKKTYEELLKRYS